MAVVERERTGTGKAVTAAAVGTPEPVIEAKSAARANTDNANGVRCARNASRLAFGANVAGYICMYVCKLRDIKGEEKEEKQQGR